MAITIVEKCPCGAEISVTGSEYRNDKHPQNPRGAEEVVERWRETHKHEVSGNPDDAGVSENPDELPMIIESASSHERALPFGFTAEDGAWN